MKRSGKVHWLTVAGIASGIGIAALLIITPPGPSTAAAQFMEALAKGDTKALTELTLPKGKSKEQVQQDWEFTTQKASKYYRFVYQLKDSSTPSPNLGSVKLDVVRNAGMPTSLNYEEHFELGLEKVDGKWLVDVQSISREMYPFLPR